MFAFFFARGESGFAATAFGAAFGYTVMARESLAIGRMTKLVKWASADYYYASIILSITIAIIILLWELLRKRTPANPDSTSL